MDGTSNLNSTTTNGFGTGPSGSPIRGVIAAIVVAIILAAVIVMAFVPCMLNWRRQRLDAQMDIQSQEDAPDSTTGLQTLNSTSPAQNYKLSQASKPQLSLASHKSNVSEVCVICLEVFGDLDRVRRLKCQHVFHRECIDPWFQGRHFNCPLCKSVYVTRSERSPGV